MGGKKKIFSITETLEMITKHTGLDLELCDYFTGFRNNKAGKYFNVILSKKICESKDYDTLELYAKKYKLIHVEPNGVDRVAVFPKLNL